MKQQYRDDIAAGDPGEVYGLLRRYAGRGARLPNRGLSALALQGDESIGREA